MPSAPRFAVSAFEPFGGRPVNRSQVLLKRLERMRAFEPHVLPVAFALLPAAVEAIAARKPQHWLMLGEAASALSLRLEHRAWNRIDARLPDNLGRQPRGTRVARGPSVRRTTLPVEELATALRKQGMAAQTSRHAGRFACNAAYYLALGALGLDRVLFIHVPADPIHGSDAILTQALAQVIDRLSGAQLEAPYTSS